MRARLEYAFPLIIAAVIPLGGLALAGVRLAERQGRDALLLLGAAVLGAIIWTLALTA